MQATRLSEIFSHPSFLTLLATILIVIANIIIGVSMLPKDVRQKRYTLHRTVYWMALVSFGGFLIVTHRLIGNSLFHYAVLVYFATLIPLSRRWNETLHAILSSIGLVLLVGIAAFSLF